MESKSSSKKIVSVVLTAYDYCQLTELSQENGRTRPGYLRWLLHRHFREIEAERKHLR